MISPTTATSRRRLLWRRFIERQTLIRHPVSLTRQRIGIALLILLLASLVWYAVIARDESIRQRAIEFLRQATAGEVSVERARFQMFGGITLYGVQVAVPYNKDLDASAVEPQSRDIFSATSLKLIHNPWRLLLGDLRVERIIAVRPRIVLTHNVDTGLRNWQLLAGGGRSSGPARLGYRPDITVRSAAAEVVSIHTDGSRTSRTVELDADIRPHRQIKSAYSIEVRRFTNPAERTTVVFDPGARMVTNTPFVDAQTVRLQLPRPVQDFFDRISLRGDVKISRLVYDAESPEGRDSAIEVRNVRCSIPLSMLGSAPAADGDQAPSSEEIHADADAATTSAPAAGAEYAVVVNDVQGRLELRGQQLTVDVTGIVNEARIHLVGSLENVDASLDQIGMDVQVHGTGVRAPEGPLRERIRTHPSLPWEARFFFQDYDPHGDFDVDLHVVRAAGPAHGFRLEGTLRPQGASAGSRWFPYVVENLHGLVRFDPPNVFLENVEGRHGPATIQANGKIDRSTWCPSVSVDITGTGVPLDSDLFEPLSPEHQALWRRFDPRGSADITVHIVRPGAGENEPWPPWETTVSADLVDAQMCFREYPYPMRDVHGRLEIQQNRIRFVGLTGHRDDASVRIDGYADFGAAEHPAVELRIEAGGLRLDDALAAALPPEGREVLAQFQPEGLVDLLGTVSLQEPGRGLVYDLRATLRNATLCYRYFPYRIRGVTADVAIRPEDISVLSVSGSHGPADLSASGTIRRTPTGFVADLNFDCGNLPLDQELHDALPDSLKEVWHLLEPAGAVRVQTALHYVSEDGRNWHRHHTDIVATNGTLRFSGFPLALTSVAAHVRVTDRSVEVLSLHGRAAGGEVDATGTLDLTGPGHRGAFVLNASNMSFSDELLAASPPALGKALELVKPGGRFDLRLDQLRVDTDEEGRSKWEFAGRLRLNDAQGNLGFIAKEVTGTIAGHGVVDPDGGVELDARAELARAVLGGWHLEDATAHLVADPTTRTMQIEDFAASAYDGEAVGFAEIAFSPAGTSYQLSATARDLQLDRYMTAHHVARKKNPSEPAAEARGSVYGNLVMRGSSGDHGMREGTGEVFIREAQIAKLPIMLAIFRVLNLAPDENAFHDGWLKYNLSGDDLTFQRIDLQGNALSFIGGGKINLRSRQLDVILLAGSPVRLRVPILTELLEGAAKDLMEVRVTGTPEEPRISPQSLENLNEVLKTLFPEPTPPRAGHEPPASVR